MADATAAELKRKCPFRMIGAAFAASKEGNKETRCVRSLCAWWDGDADKGECAIFSIASHLEALPASRAP